MRSRPGMVSVAPILAVAALVGLGATGYQVLTGACPMSCPKSLKSSAVPPASTTTKPGECPMGYHAKTPAAEQAKLSDCGECPTSGCEGSEHDCPADKQCPEKAAPDQIATTTPQGQ